MVFGDGCHKRSYSAQVQRSSDRLGEWCSFSMNQNNAASSSYITRGKTVNRILLLSPCGGSWNIILGYLGPPGQVVVQNTCVRSDKRSENFSFEV